MADNGNIRKVQTQKVCSIITNYHKQEKKNQPEGIDNSTLHTKIYTKCGTRGLFVVIFVHPDVDVDRGGTCYNSCPVNTANNLKKSF